MKWPFLPVTSVQGNNLAAMHGRAIVHTITFFPVVPFHCPKFHREKNCLRIRLGQLQGCGTGLPWISVKITATNYMNICIEELLAHCTMKVHVHSIVELKQHNTYLVLAITVYL